MAMHQDRAGGIFCHEGIDRVGDILQHSERILVVAWLGLVDEKHLPT